MKNILITAGGTEEPIDAARVISNSGTGRVGSLIADEFAKLDSTDRIFYICAKNAMLPKTEKAQIIKVGSVEDLQDAVIQVTKANHIDIIIHSMAVSDYTVRSVTTAGELARYLAKAMNDLSEKTASVDPDTIENEQGTTEAALEAGLLASLYNTDIRKTGDEKLSSRMKAPLLLLEQTPKVLASLRSLAPDAVIIGFKLMSNVERDDLIETATKLMMDNACDYVLANDSQYIHGDEHLALLIDREGNIREYATKQAIAAGIVSTVTSEETK